MKFEKFIKRIGSRGMLLTDGGIKWICDGNVAMIIPDSVNVAYSMTATMPETISEMLDNAEIPESFSDGAALIRAELEADAKAKDIYRIYSNHSDEIAIINADWSLIESGDTAQIGVDADGEIVALIVYSGYGEQREMVGIIFDENYYIFKEIKKENV